MEILGAIAGPIIGALLTPKPPPPPPVKEPDPVQPLPAETTGADIVLGSTENRAKVSTPGSIPGATGTTVAGSSANAAALRRLNNPTLQGSNRRAGSTLGGLGGGGLSL